MWSNDDPTVATTAPAIPPSLTQGFFTDGDTFTTPTIVPDWWLNMVQAELGNIVDAASLARNKGDNAQVLKALYKLFPNVLRAPLDIYVSPSGNDGNVGSSGSPLLTIARAIAVAEQYSNPTQQLITIHLAAPGTWNETPVLSSAYLGAVQIVGNTGAPGSYVIARGVQASGGLAVQLRGLRLANTLAGQHALALQSGAAVLLDTVDFAATTGSHIAADNASSVRCSTGYSISGGATTHLNATSGGIINIGGATISLSGTPAFSIFANSAYGGLIAATGATFTGTATGARYLVDPASTIVCGGNVNFFPGNTAGSTPALSPYR
jgi:hypothetical protein